jgi:hypothetical protein
MPRLGPERAPAGAGQPERHQRRRRKRLELDAAGAGGQAPATPGPGPDTAISPPPPLPASFTLNGVVLAAEDRSDTTRTVPLSGAAASLYRVKAADGTTVPEILVGTAVADANGEFAFRDLASAYYRLDVQPPAGRLYVDASRAIAPPWSSEITVHVLLLRKT